MHEQSIAEPSHFSMQIHGAVLPEVVQAIGF